ncbi:MAG: TrkA family potassium uptake protein [Acidobacteria bacterium]|nr:TrkA family potassium uptake protein [Acidobacteriota bacterium]
MYSRVAVIGLGGFGTYLVKELSRNSFYVLAIDKNREAIEKVKDFVNKALILNTTNEEAITEVNWNEIDLVMVAIGDPNLEDSILTVALLKQAGVAYIISRASSEFHSKVLRMVGADEIINPEKDMAAAYVGRIAMPNVIDMRHLDEKTVISEFIPPAHFVGKSLVELNLRKNYNISVVAVKRSTSPRQGNREFRLIANPPPQLTIQNEDVLVAIGSKSDFDQLRQMG